ncbi:MULTISPECIES: hypothetical protein [Photorhabdus]|nr:hypothetical protein [Photorhabdus tasmaniensis]
MPIIASILRNERRDTEPLLSIYVAMASTCKGIHGTPHHDNSKNREG